jgi:hypothetical protein
VPALLAMVPADLRIAQSARVEARIDELVDAEVSRDRPSLAELGSGRHALEAGARWYRQASEKYAGLTQHPAVQSLFEELAEHRAAIFPEADEELSGLIRAAGSSAAVSDVLATYLAVPSDRSHPVARRLLASATERQQGLARAEAVEEQRRKEAARPAASPCARVPDGDAMASDGPSSRDVCRAVEAEFLAMQAGMDDLQKRCASGQLRYDRALAALCLVQGAVQGLGAEPGLFLAGFQKLGCEKAASAPGYVCDYRTRVRSSNPQFGSTFDMLPDGEVITSRFIRGDQGQWTRARSR